MKNFLTKSFGILGLAIYYALAFVVRIPVFVVLSLVVILVMLLWCPLTGSDSCPNWVNSLYDWYCGK